MKIAIPMAEGRLCLHFGHCEKFALVEIDETAKKLVKITLLSPPPHEPGVIPNWIASTGATTVIVGGIGPMAQQLLTKKGVTVISGVPSDTPETLIKAYFNNTLAHGVNICDHEQGEDGRTHGHSGC